MLVIIDLAQVRIMQGVGYNKQYCMLRNTKCNVTLYFFLYDHFCDTGNAKIAKFVYSNF